ncbi:MAG: asparagine synthase (glutamine-hydrolyzing) [Lentisphaerae bacterium]|nr:asparagine synthase (glutamine-hydrolyzing) [Lentisphaerota bacterium]
MCGIAGSYKFKDALSEMLHAGAMADAIAYRGPDARGVMQLGDCIFAHRRLAIIDLDHAADQPILSADKNCMITFNGEIYNYRELRRKLESQGALFRTGSDTEVILQLYQFCGADALDQLDGMFALAIFDQNRRELILMRDRLGKKPLYYTITNEKQLIFASTLHALKQHPACPGELNCEAIHDFLACSYIPGNGSVYRQVQQLPVASIMRVYPDGSSEIKKYWAPDYSQKTDLSFEDAAVILREKLHLAAARRLIADVPCGVFLSGGIDSALIAMLAARHADKKLNAFTIGFEQKNYDERDLAATTVQWVNAHTAHGLQHHTQIVDCRSFEVLQHLAEVYGEPFADFSMLPTYFLSRFAAQHNKLVLSGDGADELFGGYERYQAMRYCDRLQKKLPRGVINLMAASAGALFKDHGKRSKLSRLHRFLQLAGTPVGERYARLMLHTTAKIRQQIYGERLPLNQLPDCGRFINQALQNVTTTQKSERFAECDLATYLPWDILTKVDRASMAASLEVRSPFLDREVVEFAASLPFEYKQQGKQRKVILKHALLDHLAPEILQQRKRGFAVPIGHWFRTAWQDKLKTHLLEGRLIQDNWMNRAGLEQLIKIHQSCRQDHSELLGNLLMLELFLEKN